MLFFDGAFGLVLLALWLFCIIDVITTDESQCRHLPKLLWLLVVILLSDLGSIAWLVAGRPWADADSGYRSSGGSADRFPEYDRPGRFAASNPDDDEAFLRQLRERAEQQRREYRLRREQELRAEQEQQRPGGSRRQQRDEPRE